MYRLLIISNDAKVEAMFTAMHGWETMGFRVPRLRKTAEEAIACMEKHHTHAIAVDSDPSLMSIYAYLDEHYPAVPIFQIEDDASKQFATIKDVYRLLQQIHADDSNDDYDENYYFKQAQERWMKQLMAGMVPSAKQVVTYHRMLRCKEELCGRCLYVKLEVPAGDEFLLGRWRYGSERLEIALRNFFGEEREHMTLHLAVLSPEEVRVLVCPKAKEEKVELAADRLTAFIEETIEQIKNYLGLSMNIVSAWQMDGLTAFAADRQQV